MSTAQEGNNVKVHYTGKFNDGTVFDSSRDREPLEFTLGQGMVIPGFENAVKGMSEGDSKEFTLAPEDAYGPYREELVVQVPREQVPDNIQPEVGMMLQVRSGDGTVANVTVKNISGESLVLDGNHALAGQQLNFEVELVQLG